ncbi:MAG: L-seryl-tRNA(Sec) selenium transferase, partial [Acidimicrobiales bacterium]
MLAVPAVVAAARRLGRERVKWAVRVAQQRVREGAVAPDALVGEVLAALPDAVTTLCPVLNATGVLLHTNLGRAPLSAAAVEALGVAAGTTDVELDLGTGGRGRRGA